MRKSETDGKMIEDLKNGIRFTDQVSDVKTEVTENKPESYTALPEDISG